MATRDYSSVASIKDFAINELAPKYFNMTEVNDLNLGLLGYTTELLSSIGEDSFNTVTTFMNEIFPNLAVIPESIFNYAALFQLNTGFATAAQADMVLFIPEDAIISSATKVPNSIDLYEFYLDNNMIISIEDLRFKPDYNIKINFKRYRNDIIYTAMYDMREHNASYKNTISNIINPYIKIRRINFERMKYLQLEVSTHQVDKYTMNDNVIDSTIINLPKYVLNFDGYIANFEVFYKEPNSNNYTQLKKRMLGTSPLKEPFCYYQTIDDNKIEISFTSRDSYFQPQYNSEINISYYTTLGESANFLEYTGTDISVTPSSELYDYNNNLTIFALPVTGASGGTDPILMEELKNQIIEKFSTVGSYTTENDLQLLFDRLKFLSNSSVKFIKKRDDIFERLFSAFTLLRDTSGEIYSTNTLDIQLNTSDFDSELSQSDTYILKPGHLFKYKPNILNMVDMVPDETLFNNNGINNDEFIYTNPFLIHFAKGPAGLSYYINTFKDKYPVDYKWVNSNSLIQFICNNINVSRNGIAGSNVYKITLSVSPTTALDNPMVIEETIDGKKVVTITDSIMVKLYTTSNDSEIGYLDMELESYDLNYDIYTFSCELETDDYMLSNDRFRVLNLKDPNTGEVSAQNIIPMIDSVLKIKVEYKYADSSILTTNEYTTETYPITFIRPIRMVRSTSSYTYNDDGTIDETGLVIGGSYSIHINSCPFIRASELQTEDDINELFNILISQYDYIEDIMELITNNYSIDIKFYNTYGKSKNFYIDSDINMDTLMDKVNISINFKIHPVYGTNEEDLIRDVKIFIKDYIEGINKSGTNSLYLSNLIRSIENKFPEIEYLRFEGINNYNPTVQSIQNLTINLDNLSKEDRINYVPEYLTLKLEDVNIEIF